MAPLAVLAGVIAIVARIAIGRAAVSAGRVDHHYWTLAAQAYRTQRGLPVRIFGKYLMEDEAQAYPPLFGFLLGRCYLDRCGIVAVSILELVHICVLGMCMAAFDAPIAAIALGMTIYALAPVLVTYNTQLNSRILGDVFLFGLLAAEVCAVFAVDDRFGQFSLWTVAVILTALVIMSHKMTFQVYLVLLVPWSWALNSFLPLLVIVIGTIVYLLIVGPRFAIYQFRAHWDVVSFWARHWRDLGAHQFRDSPIYGDHPADCSTCFHRPGMRGWLKYLRLVVSYAPVNVALPFASILTGFWPPTWLITWLAGIYLLAIGTLIIPQLKSLGGGHLYVFNAVVPGALYIAWLPDGVLTVTVLSAGVVLSVVSLLMAWQIVRRRPAALDESFDRAVSALAALPKGRIAVFPLQVAEAVAAATHHAVLWGGHGYGFARLEGFFPVLREPLARYLRQYEIGLVLWDDRYWPGGVQTLSHEGVVVGPEVAFGHWRLVECRPSA